MLSFTFLRSFIERQMSAVGLRGQMARLTAASGSSSTSTAVSTLGAYAPAARRSDRSAAHEGSFAHSSGVAKAMTATPLECANDPSCAAERSDLLAAGAYAPGVDVVDDVDDDPDAAVRRAILSLIHI